MSVDKATKQQALDEIAAIQASAANEQNGSSVAGSETPATEPSLFDLASEEGTDANSSEASEQPPAKPGVLKNKLSAIYELDDDIEEEELADAMLERLRQLEAANKEAEQRAREALARLEEQQRQERERQALKPEVSQREVEQDDKPKAEPKSRSKRLAPIQAPDPELSALCEFDPELKRFVGKDKFGVAGDEAAKQLNAYRAARDQRFEMLVSEDFADIVRQEIREDIERIAEEKAKAHLEQLKAEQNQRSAATYAEQQQAEFVGFMEAVKDRLYKLTPGGDIKKNPITGEVAWTETGSQFKDIYSQLQEVNPNAPQAVLAKKAFDIVSKLVPAEQPKDVKQETAEKKKRFLDKRKHESGVPTGNANVATVKDRFTSGNKVSLLQALLEDPDNEDNPDLAPLR